MYRPSLSGRPHDLPALSVLGPRHKHGKKIRYLAGCRCWRCRAGNAAYERKLALNRKLYGPNDLVSSARVLAHLRYLKTFGMGHKTVAKHAPCAKTGLAEIIWYGKRHVRRRTEARILAVKPTLDTLPHCAAVPSGPTLALIAEILLWGYTKSVIATSAMESASIGLQIYNRTGTVKVGTAVKVRNFHARIAAMRELWVSNRGPIPERHYVYWKPRRGRRPAVATIKWLQLRPFAVTYDYSVLWSKELKETSKLNNQLKKLYRRKRRAQKHNRRPA